MSKCRGELLLMDPITGKIEIWEDAGWDRVLKGTLLRNFPHWPVNWAKQR